MSALLGWLQVAVIIVAAGALAGAVLSAVVTSVLLPRLRQISPRARFGLLAGLALAPLVLGAGFLLVVFAPSVLDAAGLVQDHCASHSHHAFHLCFVHDQPPETSSLILGAGLAVMLWLAAGWSRNLGRLRISKKLQNGLRQLTAYDANLDTWRIESDRPIAMTLGIVRPRVYVSERLEDLLSPEQFDAVIAHEHAHAAHFDGLIKWLSSLGAELQFPSVASRLLDELEVACEQACDAEAAAAVGDRLTVAEAILTVERASGDTALPEAALGFAGEVIEARVKGLLEPSWSSFHRGYFAAAATLVLATTIVGYDTVHHAAETLLSLLV